MRFREKINILEHDSYMTSCVHTWGPANYAIPVEYLARQAYVAMLDEVTPKWKELIAKGVILNNPMLSSSALLTFTPFLYSCVITDPKNPSTRGLYSYGYVLPNDYTPVVLDWIHWDKYVLAEYSNERDVALSKAWANVDISSIQALASLGELPETLHWMASLLKRMVGILDAFSRKRVIRNLQKIARNGTSVINEMSDMWLELRYAVRPLVMEMQQAVEAWNAVLNKSDRFTARGFNRIDSTIETSTESIALSSFIGATISRKRTLSANFRAGVLFTIDDNVNELRSVWGLDQPVETIWELIPFSFMIDWFFSIGHTISAWTINPGLHPLASWITEEIIEETISSLDGCYQTSAKTSSGNLVSSVHAISSGRNTTKVITKRRLPSPKRSILPRFKLNLDAGKLIDLAAIGRGILRSL